MGPNCPNMNYSARFKCTDGIFSPIQTIWKDSERADPPKWNPEPSYPSVDFNQMNNDLTIKQ